MRSVLDKFSRILSVILTGVAAATLVSWCFVIVVFVIARSVFNVNWMFVEEYSGYCMVLLVSFSLAYGLKQGAHINVGVITELASERVQNVMKLFADFVGLVVSTYLTRHGVLWFLHGLNSGARSWFPSRTLMWPVYLLIPIGLAALSLEFVLHLEFDVQRLRKSNSPQTQGGR